MDLGWILGGSGLDLGWIWNRSGVDLGWIWDHSGMVLGWIWGGSGVALGSGSESGPDPALMELFFVIPLQIPPEFEEVGWRAGPPTGDILDPFLTSIRTL